MVDILLVAKQIEMLLYFNILIPLEGFIPSKFIKIKAFKLTTNSLNTDHHKRSTT